MGVVKIPKLEQGTLALAKGKLGCCSVSVNTDTDIHCRIEAVTNRGFSLADSADEFGKSRVLLIFLSL